MLTSDPPPPYSEVSSATGWSSKGSNKPLVDQVVVTLQEVEEALTRHAPHLELNSAQKDTIKRLTESLLKRNVQEQGALPTSLQKQFTLEHVVSKFDKRRNRSENAYVPPSAPPRSTSVPSSPEHNTLPPDAPPCPYQSSSHSTHHQVTQSFVITSSASMDHIIDGIFRTYVTQPSNQASNANPSEPRPTTTSNGRHTGHNSTPTSHLRPTVVANPPSSGDIRNGRVAVGSWLVYTVNDGPTKTVYAYADQVPRAIVGMVIVMIVLSVLATPLTLFLTIPALYWMMKVCTV